MFLIISVFWIIALPLVPEFNTIKLKPLSDKISDKEGTNNISPVRVYTSNISEYKTGRIISVLYSLKTMVFPTMPCVPGLTPVTILAALLLVTVGKVE